MRNAAAVCFLCGFILSACGSEQSAQTAQGLNLAGITPAVADSPSKGPSAARLFSGGSGTQDSPYIIATAADVQTLSTTNTTETVYFQVSQNIDMSGYTTAPAGTASQPFLGVIDGQNHTISNLTIAVMNGGPASLFAFLDGSISNLSLVDENISSNGVAASFVWNLSGSLFNVAATGVITCKGDPLIGYVLYGWQSGTGSVSGSYSVLVNGVQMD